MKDMHARKPINRQAAIVTGKGASFDPQKKIQTKDSDTPIPFRWPNPIEIINQYFIDLTGRKFGRFTVLGVYAEARTKIGLRWVVRCVCGTYSVRAGKAIKNKNNAHDRCEQCRYLAYMKRDDHFRRTGRRLNAEDL